MHLYLTKPLRSSPLAGPPLLPSSLPAPLSFISRTQTTTPTVLPPHRRVPVQTRPPSPLAWTWICHLCSRHYPLGATRRCLEDGHYFCAGEAPVRRRVAGVRPRKGRGGVPCTSQFDYVGWKAWAQWKDQGSMGCWGNCEYPSECRWGKRRESVGVDLGGLKVTEKGADKGAVEREVEVQAPVPTSFEALLGLVEGEKNVAGVWTTLFHDTRGGKSGELVGVAFELDTDGDAIMSDAVDEAIAAELRRKTTRARHRSLTRW